MRAIDSPVASVGRVFLAFAAVTLVVVAAMGLVLSSSFRSGSDERGLAAGTAQAELLSTVVYAPLLGGHAEPSTLDDETWARLDEVTTRLRADGRVLRLRLYGADGVPLFTDDGSGLTDKADDEVHEALTGLTEAHMTRVNTDSNDVGAAGLQAIEIYQPLDLGESTGALEVYLPYAPIAAQIDAGMRRLYTALGLGLAALYVVLLGLALTTTRRLRQHAQRNAYLAEHDQLTGLPNRRVFLREIDHLTADPRLCSGTVAVVDLDRFKEVNDSLGHHNGDALLMTLAARLHEAVGPDDMVARLGGDEFGLVLRGAGDEVAAQHALSRLRGLIGEPLTVSGIVLTTEASIGYALLGRDGSDAESLLQRADIAMYVAKVSTEGAVRYDDEHDHYDADRLAMVTELQRAMDHDELVLHFQPKVGLDTDAVVGVEALLRWQHPRHGLLYPDSFLPLAEQTGLIDPLTYWVLDRALHQLADLGVPDDARISVNISARSLSQPQFAQRVLEIVQRAGVPARRLVLEITETAVFSDLERATTMLARLSGAGISISLDDFGQGQTSLGYLSRLHLAELKIDRAFVRDMLAEPANATIVHSLIELAHNLGLTVVAEGIEDAATRQALQDLGCDEGQGYGLARPMDAARFAEWVATAYSAELS